MTTYTNNEKDILHAVKYHPSVSIILPFETHVHPKKEAELQLRDALKKAEKQLYQQYTSEEALPVLIKLHKLLDTVNYNSFKKGIAIFASPTVDKVLYLDFDVEERIVIDDSFEIRDIVYCKKQIKEYLVLVLSACRSILFIGNCDKIVRIKSNAADTIEAYKNDIPEKIGNFSDTSHQNEILTDKFLHQMDKGLEIILNSYPFPVFVMGTERINGHFKKITKNGDRINAYIHGSYTDVSDHDIFKALEPNLAKWDKVKQADLIQQADRAINDGKLSWGIKEVWRTASQNRGRLLLVEKDFSCAAVRTTGEILHTSDFPITNPYYIKDAVDDIIEKVLESGGDVEFLDNDALAGYDHIALLEYY